MAPHRLGGSAGGRDRRRRLLAGVVLVAGVTLVGIGWVGPRLAERPSFDTAFFATPTPDPSASSSPSASATAASTPFGPTPLPTLTRPEGVVIDGRVAVWTTGFRLLDLATGFVTDPVAMFPGQDAVVPMPGGEGWLCVCMVDTTDGASGLIRDVDVVRIDRNGREASRTKAGSLGPAPPGGQVTIQTDVDIAPDRRSAVLTVGVPSATEWTYSITTVDLVDPSLGPLLELGRQTIPQRPTPSASPEPGIGDPSFDPPAWVSGPYVRRSPDGASAFAWASLQPATQDTFIPPIPVGWRVQLPPGAALAASAVAALPDLLTYCGSVGWLTADTFVATCANSGDGAQIPVWSVQLIARDGTTRRKVDIPSTTNWYAEPLFDAANQVIWLWDMAGPTLVRIDARTSEVTARTYDPRADRTTGDAPRPGVRPAWAPRNSALGFSPRQLVGAPDGSRIYALASSNVMDGSVQAQPSLGVLVFDPATMAMVDHWGPAANEVALEPILGGKAIAVAANPSFDASGRPVPWEGSLTIRDAVDGRILERFGRLGADSLPYVIGE